MVQKRLRNNFWRYIKVYKLPFWFLNMNELEKFYNGKKVLITGGLGFIGSNLALRLFNLGSDISIIDWSRDFLNIEPIREDVKIYSADVGDMASLEKSVKGQQIIFDLAEVINQRPISKPISEQNKAQIETSVQCHRNVANAALSSPEKPRVVYPSSKVVYENSNGLPVSEDSPINPLSLYATVKATSEDMFRDFHGKGLDGVLLRLTVPYGPRSQIRHHGFGIVGWFVRQALEGKDVTIYGEGEQLGDYIYVGDVVDALLLTGADPKAKGNTYNVGFGEPRRFADMAREIVDVVGSGKVVHIPTPDAVKKIGKSESFYADIERIRKLGWRPSTGFKKGLKKTVGFYRKNLQRYLG